VPGKGLLCSESLPSTKLLVNQTRFKEGEYNAGGISFKMVTPMSRWKIGYQGKMFLHDDRNKVIENNLNSKLIFFY
jgi:hypothetical protein